MPNNKRMDAKTLIEKLGGTAAVAVLANVKSPSVSGWKDSGRIPDDKLIRLALIAEKRKIATRKELFPHDYAAIWPDLAPKTFIRAGGVLVEDQRKAMRLNTKAM